MTTDRQYYAHAIELWQDWNSKINVISRKDSDFIYEHHILHSLAIGHFNPFEPGETVLDAGTGGGFPGIPLAMNFPDTRFTLCDSIGKKVRVAAAVAEGLGLSNVTAVNARIESLPEIYDWVVTRAVTTLENFYPWVRGRFRKGILCLKGGDVMAEIASFCASCKVDPGSVSVWRINDWLEDNYFDEKFVIAVRK